MPTRRPTWPRCRRFRRRRAVGIPDRTFKDRLTLFSGAEAVDLYYFGAGHTNGDAFVVFRNARVMHSGDIFATRGLAFLDVNNGGSGVAIGDTLRRPRTASPTSIASSRGTRTRSSGKTSSTMAEFNRLFLEHARTSRAAGKTPEQAAADLQLPAKFSGYNLTGRGGPVTNLTVIYNELAR